MLNKGKRARSDQAKLQKRELILNTASELFDRQPDVLPTAADIARQSHMAKGTVYLYFKSKEQIFLALLERHYQAWFNDIREALQDEKPDIDQWINALCHYIETQPQFFYLASLSSAIIEKNVEQTYLLKFRHQLSAMLESCAIELANKIGQDEHQNCARLLMRSYALLLGLWQISHPSGDEQVQDPTLSIIQPEFKDESRQALQQLWRGYIDNKTERGSSRFWNLGNIFAKTD